MTRPKCIGWRFWSLGGIVAIVLVLGGRHFFFHSRSNNSPEGRETAGDSTEPGDAESNPDEPVRVEVVHPIKGGMQRMSTQPGTVQAFESIQLYSAVSGYLQKQTVDIGDPVKKGQMLIKVAVPELEKQILRFEAEVAQDKARVGQMKARIATAQAEKQAALAAVTQAEAAAKSTAAMLRFREQQLVRMKNLFAAKSIDERLVDEKFEQRDAAQEAHRAAEAGILTTKAQVAATEAKIEQAKADVAEAQAEIQVAQAQLERAQVLVAYSTITAPFDGTVTQRSLFVKDFVLAGTDSGNRVPLLTVQRTDKFRVVVQVPDRDVPYCDKGDPATVEIDALPNQSFLGTIARFASSEDPDTRLMRVEIDLDNVKGQLRNGMYGRVSIILDKGIDQLSIPSTCLVGRSRDGKANVYVVKNGKAKLTPIEVGQDNGMRVAVGRGLQVTDQVIDNPGSDVANRVPVVAASAAARTAPPGHQEP